MEMNRVFLSGLLLILVARGECCPFRPCKSALATDQTFTWGSSGVSFQGNISRANAIDWTERSETLLLMGLLLQRTSRRQFVIVHDRSFPETSDIVKMVQETMVDAIVLEYEAKLEFLEATLKSNIYSERVRTVLLLCSTENTVAVFATIRNRTLESPLVRWLVIANENITASLISVLREGTQVAVATHTASRAYQIFTSYISVEDEVRFKLIENWEPPESTALQSNPRSPKNQIRDPTSTKGKDPESHQSLEGYYLFPDLDSIYDDFQGRRLLAAVVSNVPYFVLDDLADGTVIPVSGIDYEILRALGARLNFTFRVLRPKDGRWGGPESDGSVSGMIGMVARYEVHLAIDEITVTALRETVVDFSYPYFLEGTVLVSRAPTKKDPTLAVIRPFTPLVWLLLVITTSFLGPIVYVITELHRLISPTNDPLSRVTWPPGKARSSDNDRRDLPAQNGRHSSLSNYSFNMFRSLVAQGDQTESDRAPIRIVLVFWYIFCLVIYSLYAGTLTAFMTIPAFEKPIDSPEDLIKAYKDGFVPAVQPGTSNEYFLKSAKSGIFYELWKLMDPSRSFPKSGAVAMEKVLTDDIVYMTANLNSKIRTSQRGRRRFHLSKEKFVLQGLGVACRTGAPFIQKFNEVLLKINQGGLVDKWINDALRKLSGASGSEGNTGVRESLALTLNHLQAAFFILFGGSILAGVTLILEILASTSCTKSSEKGI